MFKSDLELDFYKFLERLGIEAEYEPETYTTWTGCKNTVHHYYSSKGSTDLRRVGGDLGDIKYTPDFHFKYNGIIDVFVETKGREREDFTIRKKLFLRVLNELYPGSYYFVVKSLHHARNMMDILENGKITKKNTVKPKKK